jgi:hypothetical protein
VVSLASSESSRPRSSSAAWLHGRSQPMPRGESCSVHHYIPHMPA